MRRSLAAAWASAIVLAGAVAVGAETRTLEIDTAEVTRADVAVSLDGEWLVFTALGHLFRLPIAGGAAEQLTFGPWYDSDPAVSPDGRSVVFVSDRNGESNGNLFLLDLESKELRQLTREHWVSRPAWAPDGESVAYLSYEAKGFWAEYEFVDRMGVLARVRRVSVASGEVETLLETPDLVRSVLFLNDGLPAWAALGAVEGETRTHDLGTHARMGRARSRIEARSAGGEIEVVASLAGVVDRVVASGDGSGLFVRRYKIPAAGFLVPQPEEIAYVSLDGAEDRAITELESPQPRPQFALSGEELWVGDRGGLWRVDAATGERRRIDLTAKIRKEVHPASEPIPYVPEARYGTRSATILDPRLTPDGTALVFTAAGYLWRQPLAGGAAERLLDGEAFARSAAISPDGSRLVYQASEGNTQRLMLADLESGSEKTLLTVDRTGRFEPAWSPDGSSLAFVGFEGSNPSLHLLDLGTGRHRKVIGTTARWMPRPTFSPDGALVYYTARGQLWGVPTDPAAGSFVGGREAQEPSLYTGLTPHAADLTVSPDGRWLAFRRNEEIWLAPFGPQLRDADTSRVATDGGFNYSFSPDSSALVYSTGSSVWRQPLDGGERVEIPVSVDLSSSFAAPTLLREVRVLDLEAGAFGDPTSMLIESGRIAWIGAETGRTIPAGVRIVEAAGRYAIPGLFDSHTHVATPIHFNPARDVSHMAANVAWGVTSVRDMGSDLTLVGAWNDRRSVFGAPVPRIFSYGAMTEVEGPFFHGGSLFAGSPDEARGVVRKETRDGAAGIKSYFTLPWPLQRAVAEEARRQKAPVAAHGLTFREMIMGPVLGRGSIEHQPSPIRVYEDVLKLIAATGVRWDPTVAPIGGNGILLAQEPHLLSHPRVRAYTSRGDYALAEEVELFSVLDPEVLGRAYGELLVSLREGHEMGVRLLAGTDALNPNVFYGHGLHTELWHLARAGIEPIDVLRIATVEAAEMVGAEDHLGSLESGKLADVVLLDENPLADIRNATSIWRVILEGRVFAGDPRLREVSAE